MKKVLVAAILGLAAVASVKGQGSIFLYSYAEPGRINYGTGAGGTQGTGLVNGLGATTWTVGIYYVNGNNASAINAAMAGDTYLNNDPIAGQSMTLSGVTTSMLSGYPGQFGNSGAPQAVVLTGNTGTIATFVVVAYNGANYATSSKRGHSVAFTGTPAVSPAVGPDVGNLMTSFQVSLVPEPSTFALAGLGLAGLLIFRRRN